MLARRWTPQAYVVLNLRNAKLYHGITVAADKYWWTRIDQEFQGATNKHFYRAIRTYGKTAFHRYLFAVADTVAEIREVERQQIRDTWSHDPNFGYNKTMGGEGVVPTEETREKLRRIRSTPGFKHRHEVSIRRRSRNPTWRANVGKTLLTVEMKQRVRTVHVEKRRSRTVPWTTEMVDKVISDAFPSMRSNPKQLSRARRWIEIIRLFHFEYKSRGQVAAILNTTDEHIRDVLTRISRTAKGQSCNGGTRRQLGRPPKGCEVNETSYMRETKTIREPFNPAQVKGAGVSLLIPKDL